MKGKMNDVKGNVNLPSGEFAHSMFVDEDYSMMGGHVDSLTRSKIINGEYINFT